MVGGDQILRGVSLVLREGGDARDHGHQRQRQVHAVQDPGELHEIWLLIPVWLSRSQAAGGSLSGCRGGSGCQLAVLWG